jgi:hypothetical protein
MNNKSKCFYFLLIMFFLRLAGPVQNRVEKKC